VTPAASICAAVKVGRTPAAISGAARSDRHDRRAEHGVGAGPPAGRAEVVADARDDVRDAAPEIDAPVAVEVLRVAAPARRHELRPAHRAGVRPADDERIERAVAREQQEFLQLRLEERDALDVPKPSVASASSTRYVPVTRPKTVSMPMIATTMSSGTPYVSRTRTSVASCSFQKRTPASMRARST
jgi:hypothetical protein